MVIFNMVGKIMNEVYKTEERDYITGRLDDQLSFFDKNAIKNQKYYKRLKRIGIFANLITTILIALAFTVPEYFKVYMGIIALFSSTLVLGTYQLEELENFGAKWEKYRLVAEQLKSEKHLFLNGCANYDIDNMETRLKLLVDTVEHIIRGTDLSYFSLIVEPGKRLEKRLEQLSHDKSNKGG